MTQELLAQARALGAAHESRFEGLDETTAAREALAAVAAGGLAAWAVPERDGGAPTHGLATAKTVSVRALCALRAGLAYHHGMLDVMLVMQGLGSFPVARGGAAPLRAEVLPAVARGERVAAFGLTEEGAGSSLSEVATRAERTPDGWRLNGAKTFISNAGVADFYSVLARTSGEPGERDGLTMFYVPADSPGLETQRFEVIAPHPIGEVRFRDVDVPDTHRLGDEGAGLALALGTLARFRTSVAAAANGFARRALDEARRHLKARAQFGKPLAANQGLRFDVAEMDTRLRAAELLVDEAAAGVDAGGECTLEVARAKLYATETAGFVCDRAVQLHGGLGVKRGSVVERLFRDVRALRIYEGTSEVQRLIIAKEVLR